MTFFFFHFEANQTNNCKSTAWQEQWRWPNRWILASCLRVFLFSWSCSFWYTLNGSDNHHTAKPFVRRVTRLCVQKTTFALCPSKTFLSRFFSVLVLAKSMSACVHVCVHTREEEGIITFMLYAIQTMHICLSIHTLCKDIIAIHFFFELYIFISIHRQAEHHKSWATSH